VPFQRHMGLVSGALLILGTGAAIATLTRNGSLVLVVSTLGFLVPMTVSMLAGEVPNCFRSSGVIGPALVLAAYGLRYLGCAVQNIISLLHKVQAVVGMGGHQVRIALRPSQIPIAALLLVLLIGYEANETRIDYLFRFREVAPDVGNYSIAKEIAQTTAAFSDGPAYVKVWPHWYDGRAVSEHLLAAGETEAAELASLDDMANALSGNDGPISVSLHPDDEKGLAWLQTHFARGVSLIEHFPDGTPAFVRFVGAR